MTTLPAPRPPYNAETEPFWTAAASGRLVVPVCDACGHHIWYPRTWCPLCQSESVTWTELSGRGTVYARTVLHRSMGPWREAVPYVAAYVELDEGPRVLANVVADDPGAVTIGTPVMAMFVALEPDEGAPPQAILRFAVRDGA